MSEEKLGDFIWKKKNFYLASYFAMGEYSRSIVFMFISVLISVHLCASVVSKLLLQYMICCYRVSLLMGFPPIVLPQFA